MYFRPLYGKLQGMEATASVKVVPPEVWAKWGARPLTREEVAAEKRLIQKLRDKS